MACAQSQSGTRVFECSVSLPSIPSSHPGAGRRCVRSFSDEERRVAFAATFKISFLLQFDRCADSLEAALTKAPGRENPTCEDRLFQPGGRPRMSRPTFRLKATAHVQVVDRLFSRAELRLGTKHQLVVRIFRTDAPKRVGRA